MSIRCLKLLAVGVALVAVWSAPLEAAEIYRWVDANGVVHYSDEKPRDDAQYSTLEFADTRPTDYDPAADPYSIVNQARRLNDVWIDLANARAERQERRRSEIQEPPPAVSRPVDTAVYYRRFAYFAPFAYAPRQTGDARRQAQAMQELDLAGPRPHSVNSGTHRARVERSAALPTITPSR